MTPAGWQGNLANCQTITEAEVNAVQMNHGGAGNAIRRHTAGQGTTRWQLTLATCISHVCKDETMSPSAVSALLHLCRLEHAGAKEKVECDTARQRRRRS